MAQMSEKMTKSELRAPDAFQRTGGDARDWLERHRKPVAVAVAALLLAGVALAVGSYVSDRGEARASKELGEALKVLSRPVAGEALSEALPDSGPAFKTQRERDEAVRKALTDFRAKNGGTVASATAALPLAKAEHRLGNYDAATKGYETFLSDAPKSDALRAQALEGLGYAYEAKGDLPRAVAAFERLAREGDGEFLAGMGDYHAARMLILQSMPEDAAKAFSKLQTAHPSTAAARLASERLTALAAQGVKVPAAAAVSPDAGVVAVP